MKGFLKQRDLYRNIFEQATFLFMWKRSHYSDCVNMSGGKNALCSTPSLVFCFLSNVRLHLFTFTGSLVKKAFVVFCLQYFYIDVFHITAFNCVLFLAKNLKYRLIITIYTLGCIYCKYSNFLLLIYCIVSSKTF